MSRTNSLSQHNTDNEETAEKLAKPRKNKKSIFGLNRQGTNINLNYSRESSIKSSESEAEGVVIGVNQQFIDGVKVTSPIKRRKQKKSIKKSKRTSLAEKVNDRIHQNYLGVGKLLQNMDLSIISEKPLDFEKSKMMGMSELGLSIMNPRLAYGGGSGRNNKFVMTPRKNTDSSSQGRDSVDNANTLKEATPIQLKGLGGSYKNSPLMEGRNVSKFTQMVSAFNQNSKPSSNNSLKNISPVNNDVDTPDSNAIKENIIPECDEDSSYSEGGTRHPSPRCRSPNRSPSPGPNKQNLIVKRATTRKQSNISLGESGSDCEENKAR